jgi:hypothetical protein
VTASAFAGTGRYSIYTGRATNWPAVVLSVVAMVPLFALGGMSNGGWRDMAASFVLTAVGVLLCALTTSSVSTTAGPNGVSVRFGLLRWPRCNYRLEQIERAEVIDLKPWFVAYGFWWTPRRTCCTVRSGPTLRLTLRTGRTVTITVPKPHAAVANIHVAMSA